ncbi:MAG: 30S ribosomal protein S5 [Patescibacteria group bacterium]
MEETKEKEIIEETPTDRADSEEILVSEPIADIDLVPKRDFKKNIRKPGRRETRVRAKPEFDNKLLEIRRVARVVSGGRRFSFAASIVVGDRKGRVGVGVGKAGDTPIAIDKALRNGKKNMTTFTLTQKLSIPHSVEAKYGASRIMLSPAPGKGVVAGGSVRAVLELAGITAVSGKILSRSKNKINNARATIKALEKLKIK